MAEKNDYKAFLLALKANKNRLYILSDQEPYLREQAVRALREQIAVTDDLNYFLLDGDSLFPENLADALDAPPMFASQKLIHIRHFKPSHLNEEDAVLFQSILEDIPVYAVVLLELSEPAIKRAKSGGEGAYGAKLLRSLSKFSSIYTFETPSPEDLSRLLSVRFREEGKDIAPSDIGYFLTLCQGSDTLSILGEAQKLFSIPRREIKHEDIDSLVTLSPNAASYLITNALFEGNIAEALSIYRTLLKKGTSEYQISSILHGDMKRYYAIRLGLDASTSDKSLMDLLSISDKRLFVLKRIVMRVETARLRRCLTLCAENEHALRTTGNDGVLSTEALLFKLATLLKR